MIEVSSDDERKHVHNIQNMLDMMFKMDMERDEAQNNFSTLHNALADECRDIKRSKEKFQKLSTNVKRFEDRCGYSTGCNQSQVDICSIVQDVN